MARELTNDQQSILTATLPQGGRVELMVDTSISAAEEFAGKWAGVFAEKGWDVSTSPVTGGRITTPTGLVFLSQGDLPLSDKQKAVVDALNAADVPFTQLDGMIPEGMDVRMMFGRVGA